MFCPACGSNSSRSTNVQFSNHNAFPWYQCIDCGSFFDSEAFDKDKYFAHARSTDYGREDLGISVCEFKAPMYSAVLELLKIHWPPPASILDVGCSYGGFLVRARNEGYGVCGSDINPQAVEYVQSLGIPAIESSSIRDIDLIENNSLDVLTCLDCNYYWANQPSELRYAFEKLKAGGYLVMRVAAKSWMCEFGLKITKIAPTLGARLLIESVNDHRFSMPVRSLLKVVESCGFEVVYASPRGAAHSQKSRWTTRASFALGSFIWAATGIFMAPGALIFARKRCYDPSP